MVISNSIYIKLILIKLYNVYRYIIIFLVYIAIVLYLLSK